MEQATKVLDPKALKCPDLPDMNGQYPLLEKMKTNPTVHLIENTNANEISSLKVSMDSKWMVTASSDDWSINIWDLQTRTLYHSFDQAHTNRIYSVEISKDCSQILSASQDKSVAIWSIHDKKLLARKADTDRFYTLSAKFSPNNRFIASAGSEIRLWRKSDLSLLHSGVEAHNSKMIWCISFHPSGQYLLSSGGDQKIRCWSVNNKLNSLFVLGVHSNHINGFCLDTKREKFGSSSYEGSIKLWSFAARKIIHSIDSAHDGKWATSMCLVPGSSQILCSKGVEGTIKFWNIEDNSHPQLLHTFSGMGSPGGFHCIAASQYGKYFVVQKEKAEVAVFEF